jgi:ABC-type phosphate transport system substrate-binding protein
LKIKKVAAFAAAAAVAVTGAALAAPAFAEPVSNSYVLVGSDTLQDSTNALINGTDASGSRVRVTANNTTLGSFDAFGSAAIQTKPGGPFFGRPAGSGAGVSALRASITGASYAAGGTNTTPSKVITGQVDIARSSSGPGTNANADGKLLYYPYARDAVAYAYKGGTAAWANISAAQLKQIYDGTLTSIDGVTIKPRLPQTGSGTRNFFLAALGYTGTTAPAVSDTGNATAENDATMLNDGEIIPFSVASWVAQANGVTGVNTTTAAGVSIGSPIASTVPFTGTAPSLVPNSTYYANTTFGRDTYLVVERARVTSGDPKYDAGLAGLVDSTKSNSLTNFGTLTASPGAVKKKFGFLAPSSTTPLPAYTTL